MFEMLKKLFNREPAYNNSRQSNSNPNIITDSTEILSLLKDIKATAPTCSVFIDQQGESCSSEVLEINADSETITFDKCRPDASNILLQKCENVKFLFLHQGNEVSFNLCKPIQSTNAHFQFLIPKRVYYPEKKANPRILDVHSLKIPFDGFSVTSRFPVSGYINDLALDSISAYVSTNKTKLERKDLLKECHIILPSNNYVLTFDVVITHIKKPVVGNAKTFLSGQIENMSAQDRIQYEHFMITVERQEIKKRKFLGY